MSAYITLNCTCQVKAEYLHLVDERIWNLPDEYDEPGDIATRQDIIDQLPSAARGYLDLWFNLEIGNRFYQFDLSGQMWTFRLSKQSHKHSGDIDEDYLTLLQRIIAPISERICHARRTSDDFDGRYLDYKEWALRECIYIDSITTGDYARRHTNKMACGGS